MKKMSAIVVGFGARGARYAEYSMKHPEELEILAVADPIPNRLESAKIRHNVPDDMLFADWRDLAALPKMADFAIVGTQDNMHYEPALALIDKGYDLLLEKPMAPTAWECKAIMEAAEKKGVRVVVCHVLRYTDFWGKLKDLLDEGAVGKVQSIIHMENVGNEHYSHSFVRGNWRNTAESSCMILAKSCHDMDLLQWLIGKQCKKVQSFGSLTYFTHENRPEGAPDRCTQGCPHADTCNYNAIKLYCEAAETHWFRRVAAKTVDFPTDEQVREAIETGPYGRCVFACDNDVVDHQVVNLEFEDGCTVSFTMCAFNKGGRFMRIFGTKGEIEADMDECNIKVYSFDTHAVTEYNTKKVGHDISAGHGGGDQGIVRDAVKYLSGEEQPKTISSVRTSYLSHLMAFAAEESRLTEKVVDLDRYTEEV